MFNKISNIEKAFMSGGAFIVSAVMISFMWITNPNNVTNKPVIVTQKPEIALEWKTFACTAGQDVKNIYEDARVEVAKRKGNVVTWRVFQKDKKEPSFFDVDVSVVRCGYMKGNKS